MAEYVRSVPCPGLEHVTAMAGKHFAARPGEEEASGLIFESGEVEPGGFR